MTRRVVKSVKNDRNGPKSVNFKNYLKGPARQIGRPDFTAAGPAASGRPINITNFLRVNSIVYPHVSSNKILAFILMFIPTFF
jgi:hypothetical protein